MISKAEILSVFDIYRKQFPNENDSTALFSEFLAKAQESELFTRKNFGGHITTSAFIIDEDYNEMLLLKHKSLGRWLQPGGHVEADASLRLSALREAIEETGIPEKKLHNISIFANGEVPFDIDSHYIPANPKKQEEGHYHHDLRYLFVYTGDGKIKYNEKESTGLKWVSFMELMEDDTFGAVVEKIDNSEFIESGSEPK